MTKQSLSLLISSILRIFVTFIILFTLNIPVFLKIVSIILADSIDCWLTRFLVQKWNICKGIMYQRYDKINDMISYSMLLFYMLNHLNGEKVEDYNNNEGLSNIENKLLIGLFVYRFVGTIFFLGTNNRKFLFYFPNFFLEIALALFTVQYFPNLQPYKKKILTVTVIAKVIIEYFMHFRSKN
jgi:hypothetical protein